MLLPHNELHSATTTVFGNECTKTEDIRRTRKRTLSLRTTEQIPFADQYIHTLMEKKRDDEAEPSPIRRLEGPNHRYYYPIETMTGRFHKIYERERYPEVEDGLIQLIKWPKVALRESNESGLRLFHENDHRFPCQRWMIHNHECDPG